MAKDNTSLTPAFSKPPAGKTAAGVPAAPAAPAPGAVSSVTSKVSNIMKKVDTSKLAVKQTGASLLHSTETMGTLFVASAAEGYMGSEKLKIGGIDVRAPLGLAAQAYGAYQILNGEKSGQHALALGTGVTGSLLASMGRDAGQALREKRDGKSAAPAPASPAGGFRGESPLVTIPHDPPEPEYGYVPQQPQLGYQAPPPGYPHWPQQGYPMPQPMPQPMHHPLQLGPGNGYPMQQNVVQNQGFGYAGQPQMGAQGQVYQQPMQPGPMPGYPHFIQAQPGPVGVPGGLLPDPTPRIAGNYRELMESPETQAPASFPQMIVTPDGSTQSFQGPPRMMVTPGAQPRLELMQQRLARRQELVNAAMAHVQQANQAAPSSSSPASPDATTTLAGSPADATNAYPVAPVEDPTMSGMPPAGQGAVYGDEFAGPGRRFFPAQVRRIGPNRFPSSAAGPEPETA